MKTSNRKSCVAGSRTDAEHWYNLKRSPGPYHYPQTIHYKFEPTFKSICMAKPLQIVNIIWTATMPNQYISNNIGTRQCNHKDIGCEPPTNPYPAILV